MVTKRILFSFVIILLVTWIFPASGAAEKVRSCYPAIAGNIAPLWIAKESGLFQKHGLDADLTYIQGGSTATAAMLSGDVAMCMIAGSAVIQSRLSGSDIVFVAGIINTFDFTVFGGRGISRVEELKGKKVAISRFGSSTDFAIRYFLEKSGLRPSLDVAILQIGGTQERLAALDAGTVQATLVNPPMTLVARERGFRELAELGNLGVDYQHAGLVASQRYLRNNRDQARRFIRAFMEAIQFYRTRKEQTLQIIGKYARIQDKKLLEETYLKYLDLIPKKPYPTIKGIEFILREIAKNDPRGRALEPKDFVDMSFIAELDGSGFFDR